MVDSLFGKIETLQPFKGHKWADPSVSHLQELMRYGVVDLQFTLSLDLRTDVRRTTENRDEARKKGEQARIDMVRNQ